MSLKLIPDVRKGKSGKSHCELECRWCEKHIVVYSEDLDGLEGYCPFCHENALEIA